MDDADGAENAENAENADAVAADADADEDEDSSEEGWRSIDTLEAADIAAADEDEEDEDEDDDEDDDDGSSSGVIAGGVDLDRALSGGSHSYLGAFEDLPGGFGWLPDSGQRPSETHSLPLLVLWGVVLFPGQLLPLRLDLREQRAVLARALAAPPPARRLLVVACAMEVVAGPVGVGGVGGPAAVMVGRVGTTAEVRSVGAVGADGAVAVVALGRQRAELLPPPLTTGAAGRSRRDGGGGGGGGGGRGEATAAAAAAAAAATAAHAAASAAAAGAAVIRLPLECQSARVRILPDDAPGRSRAGGARGLPADIAAHRAAWGPVDARAFDARALAAAVADALAVVLPGGLPPAAQRAPSDVAYAAASRLPLQPILRQALLAAPHTAARLRLLLSVLRRADRVVCARCGALVASLRDLLGHAAGGGAAGGGAFVNAHGHVHDLATFAGVVPGSAALQGRPTEEFSWFPGYAWTICACARCGGHLGWRFTVARRGRAGELSRGSGIGGSGSGGGGGGRGGGGGGGGSGDGGGGGDGVGLGANGRTTALRSFWGLRRPALAVTDGAGLRIGLAGGSDNGSDSGSGSGDGEAESGGGDDMDDSGEGDGGGG